MRAELILREGVAATDVKLPRATLIRFNETKIGGIHRDVKLSIQGSNRDGTLMYFAHGGGDGTIRSTGAKANAINTEGFSQLQNDGTIAATGTGSTTATFCGTADLQRARWLVWGPKRIWARRPVNR